MKKPMKGGDSRMSKNIKFILAALTVALSVSLVAGATTRDKGMWGFLNGVSVCDKGMWG